MKEITLKIPDKNFPFFMELVQKLGFVQMEDKELIVPEHHKKIITRRLKSLKKEELLNWNKVKDDFKVLIMQWTIEITSEAKADIQQGIDWYNIQQKRLGKRFHNEVKSSLSDLEKNPFYAIRYNEVRCISLNKFPYLIHFTVEPNDKRVIILGILHTSLNPEENWFKNK